MSKKGKRQSKSKRMKRINRRIRKGMKPDTVQTDGGCHEHKIKKAMGGMLIREEMP
jgi:hypothetical protein